MTNIQQALLLLACLSIFSPLVQCAIHIGDQEVPTDTKFEIISNAKVFNAKSINKRAGQSFYESCFILGGVHCQSRAAYNEPNIAHLS